MEILKFIFQSFWHFIGFTIILSIIGSVILKLIAIINIRRIGEYEDKNQSKKVE